jgi:hypothetical protein
MNDAGLSKTKKTIYLSMAFLMFAVLLALTGFVVKHALAASEWVALAHDIDHRMTRPKFMDINSDGIRSPREASDIKDGDFNIIFLGDSFIHGFILQYKLAPPKRLEEIAREKFKTDRINVWNFGWTTSSPILQYRLLKDIGKKYQPDLVILAVDMSDYRDDYFYRHMIRGDGVYKYVKKYPRTLYVFKQFLTYVDGYTGWHKKLFGYPGKGGYFAATQPMEETRVQFDEVYDSLNQVYEYCEHELHVPLVVIIPPRHWQYTDKESPHTWEQGSFDALGPYALENYRYFDEKRTLTPYPLISLLDDFKSAGVFPTTFDKDSHWNQHGARLAAEAVFNHVLTAGYFSTLNPSALHSTTAADKSH